MRWASASSTATNLGYAVKSCVTQLQRQLPAAPDVAIFTVNRFPDKGDAFQALLRAELGAKATVGCRASIGTLSSRGVVYEQASLSVLAGICPGVRVETFHASSSSLPALPDDAWADLARAKRPAVALLLGSTQSADFGGLAARLGTVLPPHTQVVGGVVPACGGRRMLFWDDAAETEGAVGMLLWGDVEARVEVADELAVVFGPATVSAADEEEGLIFAFGEQLAPADAMRELGAAGYQHVDLLLRVEAADGGDVVTSPFSVVVPEGGGGGVALRLHAPCPVPLAGSRVSFCDMSDGDAYFQSAAEALERLPLAAAGHEEGLLAFSCGARSGQADGQALVEVERAATGMVCVGELALGRPRSFSSVFASLRSPSSAQAAPSAPRVPIPDIPLGPQS